MSETVDITLAECRELIAATIVEDIDSWCEQHYHEGHRRHLGGSVIGKSCARELYYGFRWFKKQEYGSGTSKTSGQMLRLFNRGAREEGPIIEFLTGIGCKLNFTPENQKRISDCGGHFGGSVDNTGWLPERFGIADEILFEFKTSNMAEFNKLKKGGVKTNKPVHWAQMCVYGYKLDLRYCLYICVDKNTDELYVELLKLDHDYGEQLVQRAASIITAISPPAKLSLSSTNFACKWCNFKDVCHHGELPEVNCRTCEHSIPLEDKKWGCKLYGEIPEEVIPKGCPSHSHIPQ